MTEPQHPAEPSGTPLAGGEMLSVNARTVVLIGTILFGLVFLGLLPFWNWLGSHDHRVWLWTALAGFLLGAAAFPLIRRHSDEGRLG